MFYLFSLVLLRSGPRDQGFGHAVYCARHAFGIGHNGHGNGNGNGRASGKANKPAANGDGGSGGAGSQGEAGSDDAESFLLVLGDHLYRRGVGTTHACADQLIHSFLAHGEAGKPAIGLKVGRRYGMIAFGLVGKVTACLESCARLPMPRVSSTLRVSLGSSGYTWYAVGGSEGGVLREESMVSLPSPPPTPRLSR